MNSAAWSAVAASFSAFSAFLVMRIQRRNFLESIRPQLVLEGWSREVVRHAGLDSEVVKFKTVKNIGRGTALHVHMNGTQMFEDRPLATMSTIRCQVLANNERVVIDDGSITLWWVNAKESDSGPKHIQIDIVIYCWDTGGMRHETIYKLMAFELSPTHIVTDSIAPGVMLLQRTTAAKAIWRLKAQAQLQRMPLIGRAFKQKQKK